MANITDSDGDDGLACYRCGAGLEKLSLPLARLDLCPACNVELHVCRMCVHYAPSAPDACDEDDAEAVTDKTRANFCDWFRPNPAAYDGSLSRAERHARAELATLFGEAGATAGSGAPKDADDPALADANALFKD